MPKGVPNKRYTPEFKRMVVETMKKGHLSILYSVENSYLDIEVEPQERERADMAVAMFYVLKDAVDRLSVDLAKLEGDCRVVDAIYAANDVRRQMAP